MSFALLKPLRMLRADALKWIPGECFDQWFMKRRFFGRNVAVVSEPEVVRHLLGAGSDDLELTNLQRRLLRSAVGSGFILTDGSRWKRDRRLAIKIASNVSPESDARIRVWVADFVEKWIGAGPAFDPLREMYALLLDAIAASIFDHEERVALPERMDALQKYKSLLHQFELLDFLGISERVATRRMRRMEKIAHSFDEEILSHAQANSVLSRLGTMDGDEASVRDFVVSLLSGYEATALSAFWTIKCLAEHPDARAQACTATRVAFESVSTTSDNSLEQALGEAMRLYPSFPFIFRRARKEIVTRFGRISAGDTVIISPYVVQRHNELWDKPESFRPGRMRGAAHPAFVAFGVGARRCIGMRLGLYLSSLIVERVLERGVPYLDQDEDVGLKAGISLVPTQPSNLRLLSLVGSQADSRC